MSLSRLAKRTADHLRLSHRPFPRPLRHLPQQLTQKLKRRLVESRKITRDGLPNALANIPRREANVRTEYIEVEHPRDQQDEVMEEQQEHVIPLLEPQEPTVNTPQLSNLLVPGEITHMAINTFFSSQGQHLGSWVTLAINHTRTGQHFNTFQQPQQHQMLTTSSMDDEEYSLFGRSLETGLVAQRRRIARF